MGGSANLIPAAAHSSCLECYLVVLEPDCGQHSVEMAPLIQTDLKDGLGSCGYGNAEQMRGGGGCGMQRVCCLGEQRGAAMGRGTAGRTAGRTAGEELSLKSCTVEGAGQSCPRFICLGHTQRVSVFAGMAASMLRYLIASEEGGAAVGTPPAPLHFGSGNSGLPTHRRTSDVRACVREPCSCALRRIERAHSALRFLLTRSRPGGHQLSSWV
ncbi:hypothetical protein BDZ91DRAFT_729702, partial [Kalaharituber pfeilii]